MFPALIAGGASLLGGVLANRGKSREAQKDRDFQHGEAQGQMRFQERMRNTEWQAGVRDMEAAGLNPALAYQQGGASAPGGAAGSGSRADQQDVISPAVSSTMQYKRMQEDMKLVRANVSRVQAETQQIRGRPGRALGEWVDLLSRLTPQAVGQGALKGAQTFAQAPHKMAAKMEEAIARLQARMRTGAKTGVGFQTPIIRPGANPYRR